MKKQVSISLRTPQNLVDWLDHVSREIGVSRNRLINEAINVYLTKITTPVKKKGSTDEKASTPTIYLSKLD